MPLPSMRKFDNFKSNLDILSRAGEHDIGDEFVMGGILNKFSIQFELGWKVLRELSEHEGMEKNIGSPRSIIKTAYQYLDFMDEDIWLSMLEDRNKAMHIYDGAAIRPLVNTIISRYIPEFQRMCAAIETKYGDELKDM